MSFGGHPDYRFSGGDQVTFQSASQMPVVLECPRDFAVEAGRPLQQSEILLRCGTNGRIGSVALVVVCQRGNAVPLLRIQFAILRALSDNPDEPVTWRQL